MLQSFIQEGNIDCLVENWKEEVIHSKVVTATAGIQFTLTCVISGVLCLDIVCTYLGFVFF